MDTCICMADLLCYSPKTNTTLLIGYTPIPNKKFKVWKKKKTIASKTTIKRIQRQATDWENVCAYRISDMELDSDWQ